MLLLAAPAPAAVSWGDQVDVGPDYLWNYGSSLAASTSGGATYLHALYSTDYVGGEFASDSGPHEGVYYVRSGDGGGAWTAPTRLNQDDRHGDRGAISAAGTSVYAVWVSQRSYEDFDPAGPRILFFRANGSSGAPGGWGPIVRLSSKSGRVDFPSVAASGTRVYVTWVDADTGALRIAVSGDGGAHWRTTKIGSSRAVDPTGEGRYGYPSVGAAGSLVGVAWLANPRGTVHARISTKGGSGWRNAVTLAAKEGGANHGSPSVAGLGDRLAFAWTTPSGVFARVWRAGSLGPTETVATFSASERYKGGYDAAVALEGTNAIGVAWSDCRTAGCDYGSAAARIDLSWSESKDGGATWGPRTLVRGSALSSNQRINDGASVAWGDKRYVLYNGWAANFIAYDLFLKVGVG